MSLLLLFTGGAGADITAHPGTVDFPGITVEMAFGYTWSDTAPEWTDVSEWVDLDGGIDITTGRSDELQPFDAGTCTFTLDNKDRRFDPTYADGDYFGMLDPITPVRVIANYDETNHPLFYGFVEGWPQTSEVGNRQSWTRITANDALELFSQTDYSGGVWTLDDDTLGRLDAGNRIGGDEAAGSLSGERVGLILDLVGWPAGLRDIDDGVATLTPDMIDGSPRDALQTVERAEDGWLFVDAEGNVVFLGRHADHAETRMSVAQAVFTDADDSMPYAGLRFTFDRRYVYNHAVRQRTDGNPQAAVDEDSIDRFFRRKHEVSDLPLDSDSDAAALAGRFVFRYSEPELRPEPLVVDPGNDPETLYPVVLALRLLDRVTLVRTPQEVGDAIADDYRIEGISHRIGRFTWQTTLPLSPVDDTTYWTLDDDTLGLLDSGNLIGA